MKCATLSGRVRHYNCVLLAEGMVYVLIQLNYFQNREKSRRRRRKREVEHIYASSRKVGHSF